MKLSSRKTGSTSAPTWRRSVPCSTKRSSAWRGNTCLWWPRKTNSFSRFVRGTRRVGKEAALSTPQEEREERAEEHLVTVHCLLLIL